MKILFLLLTAFVLVGCNRQDGVKPSKDDTIQRQEEYDADDFREVPNNLNVGRGSSEEDAMSTEIIPTVDQN